jgi:hypothetical protein
VDGSGLGAAVVTAMLGPAVTTTTAATDGACVGVPPAPVAHSGSEASPHCTLSLQYTCGTQRRPVGQSAAIEQGVHVACFPSLNSGAVVPQYRDASSSSSTGGAEGATVVGATLGTAVGARVINAMTGALVASTLGDIDGCDVGLLLDGLVEGLVDGTGEGDDVGECDGAVEGLTLGIAVGVRVGTAAAVGSAVGAVGEADGCADGEAEGTELGEAVGDDDGWVDGAALGLDEGGTAIDGAVEMTASSSSSAAQTSS